MATEPPNDGSLVGALLGRPLPPITLESTWGRVDLADLARGLLVLFVYPHATGLPDPPVPGWDSVPGARGCTAESCGFRDAQERFADIGAVIAGLSVQEVDDQRAFAARVGLRYRLISDPARRLAVALGLPTFTVSGRTFYRRLSLVGVRGRVVKVFYPVTEPERHASTVLEWLKATASDR